MKCKGKNIRTLTPNENFNKREFQDLWNKINVQTIYEVNFDSEELINKSINSILESISFFNSSILFTSSFKSFSSFKILSDFSLSFQKLISSVLLCNSFIFSFLLGMSK